MDLSPWNVSALMIHPVLVTFHEDDDVPASSASLKVEMQSTSMNEAYEIHVESSCLRLEAHIPSKGTFLA